MPRVLIVDDSVVDRRLVQGLLSKDDDLQVELAENGKEALQVLSRSPVDLVVTDLVMPEMDGLELVEAITKQFPLVPVILMTSKGSEEIAVAALQKGASSYAPKQTLAQNLLETVQHVLSVSAGRRTEARLIACMTASECTFELSNDASLIAALVGYLQQDAARMRFCNEAERLRMGIALDEALANALFHGNLEIASELRDSDHQAYTALATERSGQFPFCDRKIRVEVTMSSREGRFKISDEGPGFDVAGLADPARPADLDTVGGRGLLLMHTFMDEVTFSPAGNEVTMVKRAPAGDGNGRDC